MGLRDLAKKGRDKARQIAGLGPAPVPSKLATAYADACTRIIGELTTGETDPLLPEEMNFVLAVGPHCENCVGRWNAELQEDVETACGYDRSIVNFWRYWDQVFADIAEQRKFNAELRNRWQMQLYLLAVFGKLEHFDGACLEPHSEPAAAEVVYSRESSFFDLVNSLTTIIDQAKAQVGATLPKKG